MYPIFLIFILSTCSAWTQDTHPPNLHNEAATTDTFQIWMVVFCCVFFCVAVRHINDFYSGETVTLVKEGTWGGRFKHRGEYKQMTGVEQSFAVMYEKLRTAERNAAHNQQRYSVSSTFVD
ncbi:hypothetical protein L596_015802 [Steinernema carpocapsae]|uniref:Uncharacterized protein n=1 Tax=Steinernema carpocapsae TaxID=34508 RepID=A0A4U5NG23_STECR|nr:hypothetical protein L596_015802 [Steinernema carpocapsae]